MFTLNHAMLQNSYRDFQTYLQDISAIALLLLPMTLTNAMTVLLGQGLARAEFDTLAGVLFRLSDLLINLYPLALSVVTSYYLAQRSALNAGLFLVYNLVLFYALSSALGLLAAPLYLPHSPLLALLCPLLTLIYNRCHGVPSLVPQSLEFAAVLSRQVRHFFCFAMLCLVLSLSSPALLPWLASLLEALTPDPLVLWGGLGYQLTLGLLGAIGINGHNFLLPLKQQLFHSTAQNLQAWQAGEAPLNVLSQGFYDAFMSMGGSGNSICLLLCILIFSRNRHHRLLALAASPMVLFNINEVLLFGLPVIFNPLLIIPFILVPLVCFVIAYGAIAWGLVPPVAAIVDWMTPPLLSGYLAMNDRPEGALLQLLLMVVGVLLYRPFYHAYAGQEPALADEQVERLTLTQLLHEIKQAARHNRRLAQAQRRVRRMMHTGQWEVHYQRQHATQRPGPSSYEALIRYRDADGSLHGPGFIADFQCLNAMPLLDQLVLQQVFSDMQQLPATQFARIGINISAMSIQQADFVPQLDTLLERYQIPGHQLEIEITEETLLEDHATLLPTMAQLKQRGIQVALDDFGAGFASFPHLMKYPFDKVKLDRSLLLDCKQQKGRQLYRLLSQIGNLADCQVLAEGVETQEELHFVRACGIELVQGYLFARPVPLGELLTQLAKPAAPAEQAPGSA